MRAALAFAVVASSAWCLSFAACGSSSDGDSADDSGPSDGSKTGPDAESPTDASSPNDGALPTDGSSAADGAMLPAQDAGFFNSDLDVTILGNTFAAGGDFSTPSAAADTCPVITAGYCTLFDCATGHIHGFATDSDNPGTLTIAGGSPNEVATLTLQAAHDYVGYDFDAAVFAPDSIITFKATGDVVPAFTQTLMLPSLPTLTSPDTSGGAITINRGDDFLLTWSGGTADLVGVGIIGSGSPKQIACEFPASSSSGVISSALLSHLPAGGAQASFLGYARTFANEGAYVVRFQAGNILASGEVAATLE